MDTDTPTDQALLGLLQCVGRFPDPSDIIVRIIEGPPETKPGTIRMIQSGVACIPDPDRLKCTLADTGIRVVSDQFLPSERGFAAVVYWKNDAQSRPDAANWFIAWLIGSSLVDSGVRDILAACLAATHNPLWIYRGESAMYPSVRSTLSRHWGTTNPKILADQERQVLRRSTPFLGETEDDTVGVTVQHVGGKSNFIDFTESPWVALYFASGTSSGRYAKDGRVWILDQEAAPDSFTVEKERRLDNKVAGARQHAQRSVMVKSPTGVVKEPDIRRLVVVPDSTKSAIRSFLEKIGVTKASLFPDIHAHLDDETMSMDSAVQLHLDLLEQGRYQDVVESSTKFLGGRQGDDLSERPFLYLRALALLFLGRLRESQSCMNSVVKMFPGSVPSVVRRNQELILLASKSRDRSRILRRVDLQSDSAIFTETFGGFRYQAVEWDPVTGWSEGDLQAPDPVRLSPRDVPIK